MHCTFCLNIKHLVLYTNKDCNYYICHSCWNKIPDHIPEEQKWKYIQLKGEKYETL